MTPLERNFHRFAIGGKQCTKCKEAKPLDEFHVKSSAPDGRNARCIPCTRAAKRDQHIVHADKNRRRASDWYQKNKNRALAARRAYYEANLDRIKEYNKRNKAKTANALRERRDADPALRIHHRMSSRIRKALKRGGGGWSASCLDYTVEQLMAHLERQFTKGMGWQNMGEWHIDHIVPLASFTITGPDDPELKRAWALTNLRPLWAKDNISKSDKRETLL